MARNREPDPNARGQTRTFHRKIMVGCRYLVFLPDGGRAVTRWPLILFLHGAGERGDDLERVKVHGPARWIKPGRDFPFILVCPQCPADRWWSNEVLNALLDEVIEKFPVDPARIYLTGLSMGGYATWGLATEYPDRFAAIAPVCGGGNPLRAARLKRIPIWAFHGARDNVVPLRESEMMVNTVNGVGGRARLTVYPRNGHDSWTATYINPRLYQWFLRHRQRAGAAQRG